jgi:hypothetical protein
VYVRGFDPCLGRLTMDLEQFCGALFLLSSAILARYGCPHTHRQLRKWKEDMPAK